MKVSVNKEGGYPLDARALRKACLKVLRAEGARRDAVLSVSSLDRGCMEELNRRYLSRQGPTDVMAFPMGEETRHGFLLGDVLICPEFIAEKREEYGVRDGKEIEFVAAHGVLHLLGYDDGDEEGAARMERRLREILGLAGGD